MKNIFTEHPNSIGETYLQHFFFASKFGFGMVIGGTACLLHAIFPFVFKTTGSDFLLKMTHDFIARMPANEDRFMKLAKFIENKKNTPSEVKTTVTAGHHANR
jgi:hypothetical protein